MFDVGVPQSPPASDDGGAGAQPQGAVTFPAPSHPVSAFRIYAEPWMLQKFRLAVCPASLEPKPQRSPYTRMQILMLVCDVTGYTTGDIRGPHRGANLAWARCMFYWLARKFTMSSTPQIARTVWRKDHTTSMSGYRKVEKAAWTVKPDDVTDPRAWAEALWQLSPQRQPPLKRMPVNRSRPAMYDGIIWTLYTQGRGTRSIARFLKMPKSTVRGRIQRLRVLHSQKNADARAA